LIGTPKALEYLDKKRNWIFDSPNTLDRDKAIEEVFGVREYELDSISKKPKGAVQSYLEGDREEVPNDRSGRDNRDTMGRERGEFDPTDSFSSGPGSDEPRGIIPELNPAHLFNWNTAPDPAMRFGGNLGRDSILPQRASDPVFGPRPANPPAGEFGQAQRDVERLWDTRRAPFSRLTDPINGQPDGTRGIMNPITARRPSVPLPQASQGSAGGPLSFGNPSSVASRAEMFGPARGPAAAAPGFAPMAVPAASSPAPQPKPAVLAIPRPRF
jgi:hypothetical protein